MKRNLIFLFFLLLIFSVYGQDAQTDLNKYWHYRYRLVHYFETVGMKQGQSLPAMDRNGDANGADVNNLSWDDGPVTLGYYIGVLATEYYLLKNNGQDLNETTMELYYALHAVYRIDSLDFCLYSVPPPAFPGGGAMLRDDIDANWFANSMAYLNADLSPASNYVAREGTPVYVTGFVSSYLAGKDNGNDAGADNLSSLLMGLDLVIQLVDDMPLPFMQGTNIYTTGNGNSFAYPYVSLHQMAKELGKTILQYIASTNTITEPDPLLLLLDPGEVAAFGGDIPPLTFPISLPYGLINPSGYTVSDNGGGWPAGASLSVPLSVEANHFYQTSIPVVPLGNDAWDLYYDVCGSNSYKGAVCNNSNDVLATVNAATSNAYSIYGTALDLINFLGGDNTCSKCSGNTYYNRNVFYAGVLQTLYPNVYNTANSFDFCTARTMIDEAPQEGPFNHDFGDYAPGGWLGDRRFIDAGGGFWGNFNGLDYMLLFNIYYIMSEQLHYNPPAPIIVPTSGFSEFYPYPDPNDNTQQDGTYSDPSSIYSGVCTQITVNQLDVYNSSQTGYAGNLTIEGTSQGILLNPTLGPIDIHGINSLNPSTIGGYFHAYCPFCCNSAEVPFYSYQPDPGPASDKRPQKQGNDSLPKYTRTVEFDTLFAHDGIIIYPNPFNSQTTIEFSLKNAGPISIYITDIKGRIIANLIDSKTYDKGGHTINYNGSFLASGNYMCVLLTNSSRQSFKMIKNN
jgi:hypothetical protein